MTQEKYIDRVNKLPIEIVQNFLETGKSEAIPVKIQHYIKQITWAAEIWEYERNITAASKELQTKIIALQNVKLSIRECREKVYESLNYFSVNSNVSQNVWDLETADRMASIGVLALEKGDVKTAMKAEAESNFYRTRASQGTNLGTKVINILLTKNLKAEDLGFENKNMRDIAKKHNDGFYINLIDILPINSDQKKQLLNDADIEEAEIINN